nr:hypothetical protein [Tanacetum cinerariifolium]
MLTEAIKQSKTYQMFIKYSTGQIPPKKSKGKVKRKTSSKKRVKKKVTLSANDNIISDDPVTALDLGKSIIKTKAEEEKATEAARQVHATHASIVTESVLEPTRRRKSGKVTSDPPKKLKGVPSLTLEEQEAVDIMQDLKECKKTSKRQPGNRGSNEGTGTILGVPNESIIVSATSKSEYSEEDKLDDEEKDDKERDADDETESDEDDIYKYKIRVRKDEDEEMLNAEVKDFDKGDEEVTNATKTYAKKTSEVKDDAKKTELPPTSSSLSVSLGFGDKFLKHSSDSSLVSTIKDTTDVEINSLLVVKIQFEFSQIQSPSVLRVPVSVSLLYIYKAALKEYDQKSALYQTMHANKSFNRANHRLYHALMGALIEDKNAMDKGVADTIQDHKRKHDDDDEDDDDEDPPAGPNQGKQTKRRRTKDSESLKKPSTTKETPTGKAPSKGSKTGKSTSANKQVEEPIAEVVMDDAGDDVYTLITKTKVAQYEIEGIEDMVPTLWSPTKVGYDKDALKGIKHYGERRVNSVSIKKLYGYGHLEEIMVKRADHQFYKFKEGDFVDLHVIDIEDMLLLAVQHKLFHLTKNDIVDFIVALRVFTRSLIIKKRVEDLQLGVESYQKKLNITSP